MAAKEIPAKEIAVTPLPGWFAAWGQGDGSVVASRRVLAVLFDDGMIELVDGDSTGHFENPQESDGFLGFFHEDDEDGKRMLARQLVG